VGTAALGCPAAQVYRAAESVHHAARTHSQHSCHSDPRANARGGGIPGSLREVTSTRTHAATWKSGRFSAASSAPNETGFSPGGWFLGTTTENHHHGRPRHHFPSELVKTIPNEAAAPSAVFRGCVPRTRPDNEQEATVSAAEIPPLRRYSVQPKFPLLQKTQEWGTLSFLGWLLKSQRERWASPPTVRTRCRFFECVVWRAAPSSIPRLLPMPPTRARNCESPPRASSSLHRLGKPARPTRIVL
jgi:hypothetical protein